MAQEKAGRKDIQNHRKCEAKRAQEDRDREARIAASKEDEVKRQEELAQQSTDLTDNGSDDIQQPPIRSQILVSRRRWRK